MKYSCWALALLLFPATVGSVEVDGIAAEVGSETILRSEVLEELQRMGARDQALYSTALDRLIDRRLMLKAAASAKLTLQDWMVDGRVREVVERSFGGDRNRLLAALARDRVSFSEWRSRLKEDMICSAMRWNQVDRFVSPSPAEMRREFNEHPERYRAERKVSVSVITLRPDESARREVILSELAGKSFEELGGKIYRDIRPEELFNPAVSREIARLSKGETGRWVEIDGWSFLIRKDDESVGREFSFAEAYDEVEANVREAASKRAYEAWIARLREEAYIKVH